MRNLLRRSTPPSSTPQPRVLGSRRAEVIAIAAQKGGVGKTTTSINLASALARFHDKRVLLIDLDPQAHVGAALNLAGPGAGQETISDVLMDEAGEKEVLDVVQTTSLSNLLVTPVDGRLGRTEELLTTRIGKEFILRDALRVTRSHFDVILLDCPPNLGNLTLNALVAADEVIIPAEPSPLSLQGLHTIAGTITTIANRLNPNISVLGVLLTRVDRRNITLNKAIISDITTHYGEVVLESQIGINSALSKAQNSGKDIFAFDKGSRGANHYQALAKEVCERLS